MRMTTNQYCSENNNFMPFHQSSTMLMLMTAVVHIGLMLMLMLLVLMMLMLMLMTAVVHIGLSGRENGQDEDEGNVLKHSRNRSQGFKCSPILTFFLSLYWRTISIDMFDPELRLSPQMFTDYVDLIIPRAPLEILGARRTSTSCSVFSTKTETEALTSRCNSANFQIFKKLLQEFMIATDMCSASDPESKLRWGNKTEE